MTVIRNIDAYIPDRKWRGVYKKRAGVFRIRPHRIQESSPLKAECHTAHMYLLLSI